MRPRRRAQCERDGRQDGRPRHHRLRLARAEEFLPAANSLRRGLLVPGLFRAGLRLRPVVAENPRGARRRRLHHQRHQDLDHARPSRQPHVRAGAHQRDRAAAGRHLLHPDRHEEPGHHDAADPDHRRRPRGQPGVLRRCARARRQPRRRGRQGLDLRQISARVRARRRHRLGQTARRAEDDFRSCRIRRHRPRHRRSRYRHADVRDRGRYRYARDDRTARALGAADRTKSRRGVVDPETAQQRNPPGGDAARRRRDRQ